MYKGMALLLLTAACGGPNFHFDPAPAPPWTRAETKTGASALSSTGSAPATVDVQRDADLATDDAKARLAQIFDSQISSRSSDWTLMVQSGKRSAERNTAEQSTTVQSSVRIENVSVVETYRDETTHQQFVRIEVDRTAWLQSLHTRVDRGFALVAAHAQTAQAAAGQKHLFGAYKEVLAGLKAGQSIEPDVITMDLLEPQAGAFDKLASLRKQLADVRGQLSDNFACTLQLGQAGDATAQLRQGLESFFQQQGFQLTGGANQARVVVTAGEVFVNVAQVANRQEQVHAATGSIKVYEPDGREVPELAVSLGTDQTESDIDAAKARNKALSLAADTLVSKFRSAFRKNFEQ